MLPERVPTFPVCIAFSTLSRQLSFKNNMHGNVSLSGLSCKRAVAVFEHSANGFVGNCVHLALYINHNFVE